MIGILGGLLVCARGFCFVYRLDEMIRSLRCVPGGGPNSSTDIDLRQYWLMRGLIIFAYRLDEMIITAISRPGGGLNSSTYGVLVCVNIG